MQLYTRCDVMSQGVFTPLPVIFHFSKKDKVNEETDVGGPTRLYRSNRCHG